MKSIILSCNTIRAELDQAVEKIGCVYPIIYLESGLHNNPTKLNESMQEVLDRISNVDQVLIIMGFCGNAVVGLKAKGFRLVIPKSDDCITLLLGSMEKRKQVSREKATYYLSKGWIDMYDDVEKTLMGDLNHLEKRYGKEKALKIFRISYRNYQRIGLIDTGTFDMDSILVEAQKQSDLMQLPIEIISGTMSFLEKFLTGPWESENFIVIKDGHTVVLEDTFI